MAPHTRLSFDYTVTVSIDMQFDTEKQIGTYYFTHLGYGVGIGFPAHDIAYRDDLTTPLSNYTKELHFTGFMDNNTDYYQYDARIGLSSQLGSEINAPTLPVPEPGTYGMLLAGLGVIGYAMRKRKA
ncbi:PEP-CTERM sorting domain-containing protein [Pseudoduganella plicata]|nr:PEP-CTERM sorting domain-containing protein [Pseudoduganella plicata]